jgi:hypothetical protein
VPRGRWARAKGLQSRSVPPDLTRLEAIISDRMRDRRICLAPRRRGADHQHYDANDRQAAAPRPVSSQGRTEERDWWRSPRQCPTRWPGVHLGLRQPLSPPPSTQIGCTDPGGASARRALRSRVSPEFHGSPARHCDTLASRPSECRHVILPPRRAAAEIAPGSWQGRVHQPDTVVRPARPKHACTRPDSLLDLRIADNQQSPTLLVFLCQNS